MGHQRGPETREALAARPPDTPIENAIRTGVQQLTRECLRSGVTVRIVQRQVRRDIRPHIVETGVEIRKIKSHLDSRLEHTNFLQLRGSMIDGFGVGCIARSSRVPRAPVRFAKAAATDAWMTKCGHYHASHRFSDDPFGFGNAVQQAQFSRDTIIGPTLQFENGGQIFGARNPVQNANGWIATWHQTASVGPADARLWGHQGGTNLRAAPAVEQSTDLKKTVHAAFSHQRERRFAAE